MFTFSSGLVIAMIISLIFIVLLRFLAGIMVWVMIVSVILVIGYGTSSASVASKMFYFTSKHQRTISFFLFSIGIFHCYMEFASLKGQPGSDVTIRDLGLQTDFAIYLQIRQTWLVFSTDQQTFCLLFWFNSVSVTCG